jgi:hypothetical protein
MQQRSVGSHGVGQEVARETADRLLLARVGEFCAVSRASWKIMLAPVTGTVVITEVGTFTYILVSEVGKHVPYGELVGTSEYLTLYPRCRTNRGRYNRVKLY